MADAYVERFAASSGAPAHWAGATEANLQLAERLRLFTEEQIRHSRDYHDATRALKNSSYQEAYMENFAASSRAPTHWAGATEANLQMAERLRLLTEEQIRQSR